eukprot:113379-Lingulodinium_polyedra.AAC.1
MLANRRGKKLCSGFQSGERVATDPKGGQLACAKNPAFSHQCAKCLSPQHGAAQCNAAPAHPPRVGGKG